MEKNKLYLTNCKKCDIVFLHPNLESIMSDKVFVVMRSQPNNIDLEGLVPAVLVSVHRKEEIAKNKCSKITELTNKLDKLKVGQNGVNEIVEACEEIDEGFTIDDDFIYSVYWYSSAEIED